jgi:hypothetical protein
MARRLCAFALLVTIACVPVAWTLCQTTCQRHEARSAASHEHAHAHAPSEAPTGAWLADAAHACDHEAGEIVAVTQAAPSLTVPARATVAMFELPSPGSLAGVPRPPVTDARPPLIQALTAQLRV